jgi:hypothetical protein
MGHIFISFSHKDTEYAHALAGSLQSMSFTVWIDTRLDYGSQWPHEIQKQLDSCDAFILIMTPDSFASEWVQSELQRAKRKAKPVFPLLLEGDESWLSVESTQYYDVRNGKLPDDEFYADLKRAASAKQIGQTISQIQTSEKEAKPAGNIQPGIKAPRIWIAFFIFAAALGVCLVLGFPLLQRIAESGSPSLIPRELNVITPPTGLTPTAISTHTTGLPMPIHLPDGSEVLMIAPWGDKYQYTLLSAQHEALPTDNSIVRLRIRVWTDSRAGVNFWNDSFRLVSGELSLAPVNSLNEIVEANETVDGDVEFEIDSSLNEAVLRVNVGRNPDAWATRELRLVFP